MRKTYLGMAVGEDKVNRFDRINFTDNRIKVKRKSIEKRANEGKQIKMSFDDYLVLEF